MADGTPRKTKVVPVRFYVSSSAGSSTDSGFSSSVSSTAGVLRETPSSSAVADVVATLDTCFFSDAPDRPFFWLPPVSR